MTASPSQGGECISENALTSWGREGKDDSYLPALALELSLG